MSRSDDRFTARLYPAGRRIAAAGARLHAVGDQGVPFRRIAETIGHHLDGPARTISPAEAEAHFGFLSTNPPAHPKDQICPQPHTKNRGPPDDACSGTVAGQQAPLRVRRAVVGRAMRSGQFAAIWLLGTPAVIPHAR